MYYLKENEDVMDALVRSTNKLKTDSGLQTNNNVSLRIVQKLQHDRLRRLVSEGVIPARSRRLSA